MAPALRFGDIEIDTAAHLLRVGGTPRPLGRRAFAMLVVLAERAGQLISKDELFDAVWGDTIVDEANLHVHASALRKALGPGVIATVPGIGYRFERAAGRGATDEPGSALRSPVDGTRRRHAAALVDLGSTPPTLYGRIGELAAVRAMVRQHRLVTLVGIGGVGKTTLALAVAHAERVRSDDDARLVDLAPVLDPANVVGAVANALGIGLSANRDGVAQLADALAEDDRLIVVDNAEHLWETISALVDALLARTTRLRFLVTSRRPLRLPEEQRFPLGGLSADAGVDATAGVQQGALALFEARVRALDPRFRLTADNSSAVADICGRLDGLPLAIELAAARVPVLGLETLRNRLHRSLRVLGAMPTIGAPRHQTLRATFDWTHDLLSADERRLLRRLAVFVGGFGLDLAEAVISASPEIAGATVQAFEDGASTLLDDLGSLIEKSLVVVSDADPPRYRLLEVTREYALEKLVEAGEFEGTSRRHAQAVWRLFATAEAGLNEKIEGALSRGQFLRCVTPEVDNLRAARAWSGTSAHDHALSVGLAGASTEALRLLGCSTEALRSTLALRDVAGEPMPPAVAELFWTGLCALGTHGRVPRAEMLDVIDRSERLYRRHGSVRRIHVGLYRKGFALLHLGELDRAEQAVAEMASLERPAWPARAIAQRLNLQGGVEAALCRFEASIAAFRGAAALLDLQPDEGDVVLNVLANLSTSLLGAKRDDEALEVATDVLRRQPSPVVRNVSLRTRLAALTFLGRLDEAADVSRQAMPDWLTDDMLLHMLSVFAWLAYRQGRVADAVRLEEAGRTRGARMGLLVTPAFDRARIELDRALEDTPVSTMAQWRQEGEHLDLDQIVELCTGRTSLRTAS